MKFSSSYNAILLNKGNKYFKLYKFLFEQNQKNRKKNNRNYSNLSNILFFNESQKCNETKGKKPIIVDHYINEDKYFSNMNNFKKRNTSLKDEYDLGIYYNGDFTISRSNDGKSNNNEIYDFDNNTYEKNIKLRNYSTITPKKTKLEKNCFKNNSFYKRTNNTKDLDNYNYRRKSLNSSLNDDYDNISLYYYKNLNKLKYNSTNQKYNEKNNINLYLVPKRIKIKKNDSNLCLINKKKWSRKNISDDKFSKDNNRNSHNIITSKRKKNKSSILIHRKKFDNALFKNNKNFNDMNQINRFMNLKKELLEERVKINNMLSEFFKNPLYIKYNHKHIILDIIQQKNKLTRPKSAFS